jgi:hypothetical protein
MRRKLLAAILPLSLAACLPPETKQTPAPTIVGKLQLPAITLLPPAILLDGKPVITTCPVQVTVNAVRYSSGSVFYEVVDLKPEKSSGFNILMPRIETITDKSDPPPPDFNITALHTAYRRSATDNDLIQVHVTIIVEREDAAGRKHEPTLHAVCTAQVWGSQTNVIAEQKLLTDGPLRWSQPEERNESQKRVDLESDPSPEVQIPAAPEWIPHDKEPPKESTPLPSRRPVGSGTFIVKRGA